MVYNGIVDYHNNLVQIRFTVAGLFLAANRFIVSGLFQSQGCTQFYVSTFLFGSPVLGILGILVAVICSLLDWRNYHLMENLGNLGYEIERDLGIKDNRSYFSLLKVQPTEPRIPLTNMRLSKNSFLKKIISHSVLMTMIYSIIFLFWLIYIVIIIFHK